MSNSQKAKATAVLISQCTAYQEGFSTFRQFLKQHEFLARDVRGRAIMCLSSNQVVMMLDCIAADVVDATEALVNSNQSNPKYQNSNPSGVST